MLVDFLHVNTNVFAWSPSNMPSIPREVAEHSLDIRAGSKPVKQRLRRFDEEKRRAIGEEIHKLLAAGFIKEVFHPEWLVSRVSVRGTLSDAHYEIAHTKVRTPNSTP